MKRIFFLLSFLFVTCQVVYPSQSSKQLVRLAPEATRALCPVRPTSPIVRWHRPLASQTKVDSKAEVKVTKPSWFHGSYSGWRDARFFNKAIYAGVLGGLGVFGYLGYQGFNTTQDKQLKQEKVNELFAEGINHNDKRIIALKVEQLNKKQNLLDMIPDKFLTTLYRSRSLIHFYKPQKEIAEVQDNLANLKNLFAGNQLFAFVYEQYPGTRQKPWTIQEWSEFKEGLISNERLAQHHWFYEEFANFNQAPDILRSAKSTLKSFVPNDSFDPTDKEFIGKNFINKGTNINRLFTYAKLQRVIEEKKLSHVHLPLKILLVKDVKTGKYITGNKALKIIDTMTKFYVHDPKNVKAEIVLDSNDYEFQIFSHIQEGSHLLGENAFKDLKSLIAIAPFDVGYNNIFSDKKRDAVIVDTEFKGEPGETCILKLKRYF